MNKYFLTVVSIVLILTSCNSTDNKPDYSSMHLGELFNLFLTTKNSLEENTIIPFLDDSIGKHPYSYFSPIEKIDTIKNQLVFSFIFEKEIYWDVKIKRRNVFLFEIDRNNKLTANKKPISSSNDAIPAMFSFLRNENNLNTLPEKRIKIIELLDTVLVCKAGFNLNSEIKTDNTNLTVKWKLIKSTINTIKQTIHAVRDQSANLYFQKKFSKLYLKEQEAISELHPIWIWYYPNRFFGIIPPLPPPPIQTQEILNILDDEDEDLELE